LGCAWIAAIEELTQWEAAVAKHVPNLKIPTDTKGGIACINRWPRVAPGSELRAGMSSFGPNRPGDRAGRRGHPAPGALWRGVCDAWSLAEDLIQVLPGGGKTGSACSRRTATETAKLHLRDAKRLGDTAAGPHIAIEELVR